MTPPSSAQNIYMDPYHRKPAQSHEAFERERENGLRRQLDRERDRERERIAYRAHERGDSLSVSSAAGGTGLGRKSPLPKLFVDTSVGGGSVHETGRRGQEDSEKIMIRPGGGLGGAGNVKDRRDQVKSKSCGGDSGCVIM